MGLGGFHKGRLNIKLGRKGQEKTHICGPTLVDFEEKEGEGPNIPKSCGRHKWKATLLRFWVRSHLADGRRKTQQTGRQWEGGWQVQSWMKIAGEP